VFRPPTFKANHEDTKVMKRTAAFIPFVPLWRIEAAPGGRSLQLDRAAVASRDRRLSLGVPDYFAGHPEFEKLALA